MELLGFFEWMETTFLGQIAQTYGGVYAVVQAIHLTAMALLGGAVLATDLRLLNVVMRNQSSELIAQNAHKWFTAALIVMLLSGVFLASGVAVKVYYNASFFAKMVALGIGILFVYLIKKPLLLRRDHDTINPWVLRAVAIASIMIWFTVAATGRWIGFS